jgi:RNAse (barnase) inhibitor barstar
MYQLVRVDADEVEEVWGSCVGLEGLFVEMAPPGREVLTLRGCRPEGVLKEVLAAPDGLPRGVGEVLVEVWDGEQPVQWWSLVDAVVIAQQGDDVVLGVGVESEESPELPSAPRFELIVGRANAGRCSGVDGLFKPRVGRAPIPLELIGCEPAEPLRAALERPELAEEEWGDLLVLDRQGAVMASRSIGFAIAGSRPSVLGGELLDITLVDGGDDRPSPAVRKVWEQWFQGPPAESNLWAQYDSRGRAEWLQLTARGWRLPTPKTDESGGEYHLDGRFVTDVPGLHCAIAEALLGPGQYYGWGWDAFSDCLCGGFGVVPPFTLVWHDSEVLKDRTYFQEIVELLESNGVKVELLGG